MSFSCCSPWRFSPRRGRLSKDATAYSAASPGERFMEYILSLLVAIGVGVYLFYALLKPERF